MASALDHSGYRVRLVSQIHKVALSRFNYAVLQRCDGVTEFFRHFGEVDTAKIK